MHLQGSLHLQPLGTVRPAGVVHLTRGWRAFISPIGRAWGLSLVKWGAAHTSSHPLGKCSLAGHRVGTAGRLSPAVTGLMVWSGNRPKMSVEMEPVFSSNGVRSAQKDAKDIQDLKGGEVW